MASDAADDSCASKNKAGADAGGTADFTDVFDLENSADLDYSLFDPPHRSSSLGRLGKYDVIEVLGHGGMGVVVRALDPDLGRTVAIKLLNRRLAAGTTARRRFLREAKAAAAINHPNVLTIHSVEEQRGTPFLVMEYISGKSLREYIRARGKLDAQETLRLGGQIALGLAAAHAQGVIHRDVKPGNVMLHEGATRIRLTDFGLARVAFDVGDLTSAGSPIGTPAYMAPEQVREERVDPRADLFSLGCVLYAMLVGHSPFLGRTHAETINKVLNEAPPSLIGCNPAPPEPLCQMIDRLLRKDPAERIQSAQEVAEILQRYQACVNQMPTDELDRIFGRSPGAGEPALPYCESTTTVPAPPRGRSARIGRWVLACGLLILAGAGVGGWMWWSEVGGAKRAPTQDPRPIVERFSEISVAQDGRGQYRSLAEALAHAADGATITVLDAGPYAESLALEGGPHDVTLVSPRRAVLRAPPGNRTLVRLQDVRGVTLRGFQLEPETADKGEAVLAVGAVSATFDDLWFASRSQARGGALIRWDSRSPESSLVLRDCRLTLPANGNGVWVDGDDPAGSIEIVANQFSGPSSQIVIFGGCRRLRIAGNVFDGATNAINLNLRRWYEETKLEITNNTFVRSRFWLGLVETFKTSPPPGPLDVRVCNNLILGGERIQASDQQLEQAMDCWRFAANWWELDETTQPAAGREGRIAQCVASVAVVQRDSPDAPDYLVPAADSPLAAVAITDDLPPFVGAKPPRPQPVAAPLPPDSAP